MRRPLDLLVATRSVRSMVGSTLSLMGASPTEFHFDRVVSMMKFGLLVSDAVVIDTAPGSGMNVLSGDSILAAVSLAKTIRALPDYLTMPTGARWNGTPIALITDDPFSAEAVAADPQLRWLLVCSTYNVDYYEYVDPWPGIYAQIDRAALNNGYERIEQMESVGCRFDELRGRMIRREAPDVRRRHGARRSLETRLYDGHQDQFLFEIAKDKASWRARHVALLGERATEFDLEHYEELLSRPQPEEKCQTYYEQAPYMLGRGAFDTLPHPRLVYDTGRVIVPDYVQRSVNHAIRPKPARVVEIKTPQTRLLTQIGKRYTNTRTVAVLLAQGREGQEFITSAHKAQIESVLGEKPRKTEALLIAGMANRYDRAALELVRSYERDVTMRGFDEMLDEARKRYAS